MAESRYKVKGIALPFEPQYSSCSNIKPNKFDWSNTEGICDVHLDLGLLINPDFSKPKEKRFGWICESRFIVPNVYDFLINNYKVLFNNYYNKIFTCDSALLQLHPNFVYCQNGSNYPWIPKDKWSVYPKKKQCSMFCSPKKLTEGHVYRHQIARIALDCGFDVFGGAHGTSRTVNDPRNPWNTKIDGLKDYMFSVVVENGIYDSYYTEKLTDCFATGTIPVYCGTKKLPDIFDPEGIIWLELDKEKEIFDSLNEETYINKSKAIEHNYKALNKLKLADDDLFEMINNETNNF
jgi:hypothetical protein